MKETEVNISISLHIHFNVFEGAYVQTSVITTIVNVRLVITTRASLFPMRSGHNAPFPPAQGPIF